MRNYGQHNALLCGIRDAKHQVIVTMDDDLEIHLMKAIKLIDKLDEGYDVVYGLRTMSNMVFCEFLHPK